MKKALVLLGIGLIAAMVFAGCSSESDRSNRRHSDDDDDSSFDSIFGDEEEDETQSSETDDYDCEHQFGDWTLDKAATCAEEGRMVRVCTLLCGQSEYSALPTTDHSVVEDQAVAPTCSYTGLTAGSHCAVCNTVIEPQDVLGRTAHDYSDESITKQATCVSAGTRKMACVYCGDYTTESYTLEPYTATQINAQALQYVGEIVTYDRSGTALGLGTGFVVSSDGKIITNSHVIEGAYSAVITINSREYTIQKVLAYDATIDLAVLQINATNCPYAPLCAEELAVGSTVYAIGSSRGMTNTFSQGIVTYFNRVVDGVSHIQHDASITNGNSGGPLINEYGEVVGINTWGIMESQNLNFAVFTAEIDNLEFGTPLTMAQFYEQSADPYTTLLEWLDSNYTSYSDTDVWFEYTSDNATYTISYDLEDEYLYIDAYWEFDDGAVMYVLIDLSGDPSEYFYGCIYEDGYDQNTTSGTLNAYAYTETYPLTYDSYEGDYWNQSSLLELYHLGLDSLLTWFDIYTQSNVPGVSLDAFGFTAFE
ncbi:MAG: trypsin-like peptidase domain-containing protein [Clostridia bacterium]|nr:trypsin-like peptidase domain-containing protein [Clostridia bacterium]